MSNLLVRVKKGKCPFKKPLTDSTYKNAKPYLKKEFDARCCYSMLHCDLAGGDKSMEVEHFRPKKKFSKKPHAYSNLLYCSRHCNGSKWNTWPTYKELQAGLRFINPCEEVDYGNHIYEHIETGFLVGITPAGFYQIEKCNLNAQFLVDARRRRTEMKEHLNCPIIAKTLTPEMLKNFDIFKNTLALEIPDIPPLPQKYLYLLDDYLP